MPRGPASGERLYVILVEAIQGQRFSGREINSHLSHKLGLAPFIHL